MPKTEINYSKCSIYKIVCNDPNITECYVGSTTNFSQRKYSHKSHCNNENDTKYNIYVYQFIRDHGGWDNWEMVEIEKYECNDNNELKARERYWIEQLKTMLNKTTPLRLGAEYYQDNSVEIRHRQQERYVIKKNEINELNNKNYQDKYKEKYNQKKKCECGANIGSRYILSQRHISSNKHQEFINKN